MDLDPVGVRLQQLRTAGGKILTEMDAKDILNRAGLPVPEYRLTDSAEQAIESAAVLGYPAVLKVHSPAITHKSDVGGVKLNLPDPAEVEKAFNEIMGACRPLDPTCRVLVQKMLPPGIEAIIGVSRDAQFGPVIMFGLGGVFTELFQDVVFRLIPVDMEGASQMVSSIRGFALLSGYRGMPGGDIETLARMIVQVSDLVHRHPEILELDINPVMAYPKGAAVVDARLVLEPAESSTEG